MNRFNPNELLPHMFEAFLARFGRLTEIQELAIEPLLAGKNCVLTAATASGKTEAALAPILERFRKQRFRFAKAEKSASVKFLYLVPTRALARDIARRIRQPLAKSAIVFAVKTGDESAIKSNAEFLITTPESLDSMLANRPKILRDVRAVILDELHLYDNTPRGDHLRILLNRLRRLRKYAFEKGDTATDEIQFCALSATVKNPVNVAEKYFTNPVLIQSKGQRAIDAEIFEMHGKNSLIEIFSTFGERGIKKVLAFCQTRAECEEWGSLLRGSIPFGDEVFIHHANLSASLRHQTEEKFAQTGAALCFATSTLELGIDIGDVDLVLLIGAPDNLSSFLQRIGRGNRRTKRTNVACFYRNLTEEALFKVFLRAAQNFDSEISELLGTDGNLRFRPSVIVQQLCSYLKQTAYRQLDTEHAYGLFQTPAGEPLIEKSKYEKIVKHLIEKDFFRPARYGGNRLEAGEMWEKLNEERKIYGNLSGTNEGAIVVDNMTGRTIGFLDAKVPIGKTFLIGGQKREVTGLNGRKIFTKTGRQPEKIYQPRQKFMHRTKSAALTLELAKELGFPLADENGKMPLVQVQTEDAAEKRFLLFHNSGEVFGKAIAEILEYEKNIPIIEHNEFFIEISEEISEEQLHFTEAEISRTLRRRWKTYESAFDLGHFQDDLPNEIRQDTIIECFEPSFPLQA